MPVVDKELIRTLPLDERTPMRTISLAMLVAAATCLAVGCKNKSETSANGERSGGGKSIEGTYLVTGMEWGGDKVPDEELDKMGGGKTVTITSDSIIFTKKGGKDDVKKYKLDATKNPAEIDLTESAPDGTTETLYGIYKLEDDTLTMTVAGPKKEGKPEAKDRPKEFATKPKTLDIMFTFKKK
jgi:uncharacterized protein (TIGR03067 family)